MRRLAVVLVAGSLLGMGAECGGDATSLDNGTLTTEETGQWHAPGGEYCAWKKTVVRNGQAFVLDKGSGRGQQTLYVFTSDVTQKAKLSGLGGCGGWSR
jgi:hypothetical protein